MSESAEAAALQKARGEHSMTPSPDLEGLERLAKEAYRDYATADIAVGGGERATVTVPAFIQAMSPSVALALISLAREAEAAQAEVKRLRERLHTIAYERCDAQHVAYEALKEPPHAV